MTYTISDVVNNEYRDYSMYTILSRAIPSIVDGLKPSQRKALFCAIDHARNRKIKTIALVGHTLAEANYHHGDASMADAINKMTALHRNNAPLFDGEGSFGDRYDGSAAAARYTSVGLSKNFDKFFKDNDILPEHIDPEYPEPQFYLPSIPWVLVNGISGMAVGFACDFLPRDPNDLIKGVLALTRGEQINDLMFPPKFPLFSGKIEFDAAINRWRETGIYEIRSATELVVREIPTEFNRAGYVAHLDALQYKGHIHSYSEGKSKDGFEFTVKFKKDQMPKDHERILWLLSLRRFHFENLTVIDETNNVRKFNSVSDLIRHWYSVRRVFMQKRIANQIKKKEEEIYWLFVKQAFLTSVLDGTIEVKNAENKAELRKRIADHLKCQEEFSERLVGMPIYSLNKDNLLEVQKEAQEEMSQLQYWKSTTPEEQFKKDLK